MVFLFFFLLLSFFPVTYTLVFYGFVLFFIFVVVVVVVFLSFAFLFEENLCFSLFAHYFFWKRLVIVFLNYSFISSFVNIVYQLADNF